MDVKQRLLVEKRIVERVVRDLLLAGFALDTNFGDGFVLTEPSHNEKAIVKALFQGDEDRLYVYHAGTEHSTGDYYGWVYFVYGNDGFDVISDYTVNLEKFIAPVQKWADKVFED